MSIGEKSNTEKRLSEIEGWLKETCEDDPYQYDLQEDIKFLVSEIRRLQDEVKQTRAKALAEAIVIIAEATNETIEEHKGPNGYIDMVGEIAVKRIQHLISLVIIG